MGELASVLGDRGSLALAVAILFASVLRFLRWAAEFYAKRLDARTDRLEAAEQAVERRMSNRLEHVEAELSRYRLATMQLMSAIAEIAPGHTALADVAKILREAVPLSAPDRKLDRLVDKLGGGTQ